MVADDAGRTLMYRPQRPIFAPLRDAERVLISFQVVPAKWSRLFAFFGPESPDVSLSMNMLGHVTTDRLILEYNEDYIGHEGRVQVPALLAQAIGVGLEALLGRAGTLMGRGFETSQEAERESTSGKMFVAIPRSAIRGLARVTHSYYPVWIDDASARHPLFEPHPVVSKYGSDTYKENFEQMCLASGISIVARSTFYKPL